MPRPPGMLLQVTVSPSGWEPESAAAVRAAPVLPPGARSGPHAVGSRPAGRPRRAGLAVFSAVDQGGALAGWHAVYLDPGSVDVSRARAMSEVLAR
jgi:hypothetical protein